MGGGTGLLLGLWARYAAVNDIGLLGQTPFPPQFFLYAYVVWGVAAGVLAAVLAPMARNKIVGFAFGSLVFTGLFVALAVLARDSALDLRAVVAVGVIGGGIGGMRVFPLWVEYISGPRGPTPRGDRRKD